MRHFLACMVGVATLRSWQIISKYWKQINKLCFHLTIYIVHQVLYSKALSDHWAGPQAVFIAGVWVLLPSHWPSGYPQAGLPLSKTHSWQQKVRKNPSCISIYFAPCQSLVKIFFAIQSFLLTIFSWCPTVLKLFYQICHQATAGEVEYKITQSDRIANIFTFTLSQVFLLSNICVAWLLSRISLPIMCQISASHSWPGKLRCIPYFGKFWSIVIFGYWVTLGCV